MTRAATSLDRLRATVAALPGGGEVLGAERLAGGWSNPVWRVRTPERIVAVRLPLDDQPDLRRREARRLRTAVAAGLAPEPLLHDVAAGTLVLPWVDAPALTWELPADAALVERLGEVVGEIHALPVETRDTLDPAAGVRANLAEARRLGGDADPAAESLIDAWPEAGVRCSVHGDLNPDNLLVGPHRIVVLDWEHAGRGDPDLDLVTLAATAAFDDVQTAALFAAAGRALPDDPRLASLRRAHDLTQYAWAARRLVATDPPLDRPGVEAQYEGARAALGLRR